MACADSVKVIFAVSEPLWASTTLRTVSDISCGAPGAVARVKLCRGLHRHGSTLDQSSACALGTGHALHQRGKPALYAGSYFYCRRSAGF